MIGGLAQFALTPEEVQISGSGLLAVGGYGLEPSEIVILDARHFEGMVAVGSLTVTPRALESAASVTSIQKIYDGNRAINNLALGLDLQIAGIQAGDSVKLMGNGVFADRYVSTNKQVNIDLMLHGDDARNYSLPQNLLSRDVGITTVRDQFYQADIVNTGINETSDVVLISRQGTVTMVLGQRAAFSPDGDDTAAQEGAAAIDSGIVQDPTVVQIGDEPNFVGVLAERFDRLVGNALGGEPTLVGQEILFIATPDMGAQAEDC